MAQKISTEEELEALLESLGDTADAVATSLEVAEIKGCRDEAAYCPVANWLRRETDARYIRVDLHCIVIRTPDGGRGGIEVKPPEAVNRFIGVFDDHGYPELDEHPEPSRTIPRDDD